MPLCSPINTFHKLVFIDLETTGANPSDDRITEIGIVRVDNGTVTQWSSLVNPQTPIPPFIQNLTGITDAMVSDAPVFESLAEQLWTQLNGALFIAHNVRFDHGFLTNAFKRMGKELRCEVLCTVKLSRKLYPDEVKHNLSSLIERHQLTAAARHRALADADVLWQFWQTIQRDIPADTLQEVFRSLVKAPHSPSALAPDMLQKIPNTCGVYQFFDENDTALYISKSAHMRRHAQSHFNNPSAHAKNSAFAHQVKRVAWQESAGDIGAALLEAYLIKDLQPRHNRVLRENGLCTWQLRSGGDGTYLPVLMQASNLDFSQTDPLYGLFRSRKKAEAALRELAATDQLCLVLMGLENRPQSNAPCSAFASRQCRGACIGKETAAAHQLRFTQSLSNLRVQRWPYSGAVVLSEFSADGKRCDFHSIDRWCYLGSAKTHADAHRLLLQDTPAKNRFDLDSYKILHRALALGLLTVVPSSEITNKKTA